MPELRQDPVTRNWVAIATERAKRPGDFATLRARSIAPADSCPFCQGNEGLTPPEVFSVRKNGTKPDTAGWTVRVVPNKYPAFSKEPAADNQPTPAVVRLGPYTSMPAAGTHEVLITPHHDRPLGNLSSDEFHALLKTYQHRYAAHSADDSHKYILLMTNYGREAGASLDHPHSQLFAIPMVPAVVTSELAGAEEHLRHTGNCVFCEMVEHELADGVRIVADSPHFVVFCPYASRSPFETWVVPKKHSAYFENLPDHELVDLAETLRSVLSKLAGALGDPPYNFYLHTGPCNDGVGALYHWHIEILPKLAIQAGFELGTGVMINVVTPEDAAEFLREA